MDSHDHKASLPTTLEILQSTPDLYLILDPEFNIIELSEAYLRATMIQREAVIGRNIFDVFPDNPADPTATGVKNLKTSLQRVLKNKKPDTMAIQKYDIRKPESEGGDFEERFWSPINSPILNDENKVIFIIHKVEDVTDLMRLKQSRAEQNKIAEALRTHLGEMEIEIYHRSKEIQATNQQLEMANDELKHIALHDSLTGLANRELLARQIKAIVTTTQKIQRKLAVLFLDIDKFKLVNDTLGHKVGDHLLQIIAKRLMGEVHASDLVARLGGDEFVILLKNVDDREDIEKIAKRILAKSTEPIVVDGHKIFVSSSIGISIFPDDGKDEITLLKYADIAMYHAKHAGRNNFQFCTTGMINDIQQKVSLENRLRDALQHERFILHYQPQIDLKTGEMTGIEVLLRLLDAEGGLIFPSKFISIADETGLIVPIGEWVLRTACMQYKQWEQAFFTNANLSLHPIRLAVNISARQLKEADFVDNVKKILTETGFTPSNLELEITENPIISDIMGSANTLQQLKEIGAHIALDDFGVGYSSLNYLRQFNIDTLKIDQSLMTHVPAESVDGEIISSIIKMAHAMKISVVSEGAETKEQIDFLIKNHCDKVQCYYFSKPLSAENMTKLIIDILKNPKFGFEDLLK